MVCPARKNLAGKEWTVKFLALGLLVIAGCFAQGPLTIATTSLPAGNVGSTYSATMTATGGSPPYRWFVTLGSMPSGLFLDPAGTITGTPTVSGLYNITMAVVDSRQASATKLLAISISGATGRLSVATPSPLSAATVGQPYTQVLAANGGVTPYRWTVTPSLPAGLTLDGATGTISGTPTTAGQFSLTFQVADAAQATATAQLSLTVNASPLTITTVQPLFAGTVGIAYAQGFSAIGGRQPYTWAVISGNTGGLTMDSATGVLQGTPQTAGTFDFAVQVTDGLGAKFSKSFSLTVTPPALVVTVGAQPPPGTVGVPYNQKLPLVATGGTPPITWSLVGGSVPGLSFDVSSLILSGTPTTAGTYTLTIQAADSAGLTARRAVTITIAPAGLSITTSRELPGVVLNSAYQQTLTATGGAPPYTWTATGLPAGLSLNATQGVISGTATAAGSFAIAITVADSTLARSTDRFTLEVTLPPAPDFSLSGLPATALPAHQYPLNLTVSAPFPAPITGQAILTFSPDSGPTDRTVVFASGGTTANFSLPAGSNNIQLDTPLAIQTGTVAGLISISLRLQAGGIDINSSPAPITSRLDRASPVVSNAQFTRTGSAINVAITGYSTSREITQAVFTFTAAAGQTLQTSASTITVDVGNLFNTWYQSSNNSQYGSQFVLTQPFTIQGDTSQVTPATVTLINR